MSDVLDAFALLAFVKGETGAEVVEEALGDASCRSASPPNYTRDIPIALQLMSN